ncbi:hypothetical protein LEMLEM_LOCUS27221 [Lemmus lemmus]
MGVTEPNAGREVVSQHSPAAIVTMPPCRRPALRWN